MSDIVQNLLETYYGFGKVNQATISFASHEGAISRQNVLKKFNSTDYIDDIADDNTFDNQCSLEENTIGKVDENDFDEKPVRLWPEIFNDVNPNIDDIYCIDKLLILNSMKINKDTLNDDEKINCISSSNRDEINDKTILSQTSPEICKVPGDNSDASSSLTSRKKNKKKSQTITSAPISRAEQPQIKCNLPEEKNFTCNEIFFDMSNAFITEFPINLLDKIGNISMLYLENNSLEELPEELFRKLKYLQWLDVRRNKLTSFPAIIKYHLSLETILLQSNQFERLPLEFCLMQNLKEIQWGDNPLKFPPSHILQMGFKEIIKFLREQFNVEHPDEIVYPAKEVKSALTILCHEPPTIKKSFLPKLSKTNTSIRKKSWNYKPNNRCNNNGANTMLEAKLQWISTVKEKLNQQAAILQKIKDRDVLENWRRDQRTFNTSIKKAINRTCDDIPYGVDYSDIPYLINHKQENKEKLNSPKKDVNIRISEISMSLQQLKIDKQSGKLDITTELKRLQSEIEKLTNLQRKIHNLKNENQISVLKYDSTDLSNEKKYQAPPSIII